MNLQEGFRVSRPPRSSHSGSQDTHHMGWKPSARESFLLKKSGSSMAAGASRSPEWPETVVEASSNSVAARTLAEGVVRDEDSVSVS
jgi:hypothetical protein